MALGQLAGGWRWAQQVRLLSYHSPSATLHIALFVLQCLRQAYGYPVSIHCAKQVLSAAVAGVSVHEHDLCIRLFMTPHCAFETYWTHSAPV